MAEVSYTYCDSSSVNFNLNGAICFWNCYRIDPNNVSHARIWAVRFWWIHKCFMFSKLINLSRSLFRSRWPYLSDPPICQMTLFAQSDDPICQIPLYVRWPYLSDVPVCQMPLYVMCPYMLDAPICHMHLFVRRPYLSDAPICQTPLFVRCPYLSDAPICQMPLFVRCPYMSDAPIGQMSRILPL